MAEPNYYWTCTCGALGTDTSTAKTDAAHDDAKHIKTCDGVVLTSQDPERLARLLAKVGAA